MMGCSGWCGPAHLRRGTFQKPLHRMRLGVGEVLAGMSGGLGMWLSDVVFNYNSSVEEKD